MPNQHWIDHIKWSVIWRKNNKWVRKRFHDDLQAAITCFLEHQDQHAVLHSDNAGFPPPRRYTQHERTSWTEVIKGKKRFKKKVVTTVNLMKAYNAKGVWWCPYCIQLRHFKEMKTDRGVELYCPVCQITNYDGNVRRYNPKSIIIEQLRTPRRTRVRPRRRKRRSR